jgi:ElaB/YqjD/DUF883 family membrane-anchored ribosome-binding protein
LEVKIHRWNAANLSISLVDFSLRANQSSLEEQFMDENQNPEEAAESGTDNLRTAASDLKGAASAKVEDIRHAAGQKTDELREAAQGKAQEFRGAAESVWSDTMSQAKSWHIKGEAYVRANPTKAVLVALGLGFLLGLLFRE